MSEFVQGMLPYRTFQVGDIMVRVPIPLYPYVVLNTVFYKANLLGSSIGLYLAYNMERYYRHRREVCSPQGPTFFSANLTCVIRLLDSTDL